MAPTSITILVDNMAPTHATAEHGLSFWIEAAGKRILFDTGQGPALAQNARTFRVPLESAEMLVLSHGHYDHTGGIPLVTEVRPGIHVYAHPDIDTTRFSVREGAVKPIGISQLSRQTLDALPASQRHDVVTGPVYLCEGIGLTGTVPRTTDFEDTGGPFFLDDLGQTADPIADDMALWSVTSAGLVVVLGCCHSGIVNTLTHIRELTGEADIHAIIGGFHLKEASEARMSRTMAALRDIDPARIIPCHCTGPRALGQLMDTFEGRMIVGGAGQRYTFG